MNKKYSLLVSSCDSYSDLWDPFFFLLKKYWPALDCPIYLKTNGKKFHYDGLNIKCPLNYTHKTKTWSGLLIDILLIIETDYVVFMLDDFWLKSPVDYSIVDKCINYLDNDKKACFFSFKPLAYQPQYKSSYSEFLLVGSAQFRMTTQVGVWRKSYLLKILRKHESAWFFELFGSKRSLMYKGDVYALSPETRLPFNYHPGGVVFRGKYVKQYMYDFTDENLNIDLSREVIEEKNYPIDNSRRTLKFWIDVFKSFMFKC